MPKHSEKSQYRASEMGFFETEKPKGADSQFLRITDVKNVFLKAVTGQIGGDFDDNR